MKTNSNIFLQNAKLEHSHNYRGSEFHIYSSMLTNLYVSRFEWQGDLPELELVKIETLLYKNGSCVIVKPKQKLKDLNIYVYSPFYIVSDYTVVRWDRLNETPLRIMVMGVEYDFNEFILIKDFASFQMPRVIMQEIIYNYAERLALQDDLIKQHTNKQRMPVYSRVDKQQMNSIKTYFQELFNGALHLVFDKKAVNNDKALFENVEINYIVDKIYEVKDKIMQEFCASLGIVNSQDYNTGVYKNYGELNTGSSFVRNIANTQLNNRRDFQNKKLATIINLQVKQKINIYGEYNELLSNSSNIA